MDTEAPPTPKRKGNPRDWRSNEGEKLYEVDDSDDEEREKPQRHKRPRTEGYWKWVPAEASSARSSEPAPSPARPEGKPKYEARSAPKPTLYKEEGIPQSEFLKTAEGHVICARPGCVRCSFDGEPNSYCCRGCQYWDELGPMSRIEHGPTCNHRFEEGRGPSLEHAPGQKKKRRRR